MTERITENMLRERVRTLNKMMGFDGDSKEIGAYELDFANGGVALDKIINEGRAVQDILPRGTKRELFNMLVAYMNGIKAERDNK